MRIAAFEVLQYSMHRMVVTRKRKSHRNMGPRVCVVGTIISKVDVGIDVELAKVTSRLFSFFYITFFAALTNADSERNFSNGGILARSNGKVVTAS